MKFDKKLPDIRLQLMTINMQVLLLLISGLIGIIIAISILNLWPISDNRITKITTDYRGLSSVQYRQNGQEWGADYLTPKELDSLQSVLNGN